MTPSKKKSLRPKEVSFDPSLKVETPTIELPNKLFDEEDDVGTSTIPDLSLPSEDEEEEVKSNHVTSNKRSCQLSKTITENDAQLTFKAPC